MDLNKIIINSPFALTSGNTLGSLTIAYKTYGQLNADKSNAILICHSFSSNAHVCSQNKSDMPGWWDCMVGSGKPIDTDKYCVICINNLGGCYGSSGPTSINPETGLSYGKDFPEISLNDIVRCHKIVIDHLDIESLHAVIGGSMGGMIALEWALTFPSMVKRFISISSCGKPPASVIAAHTIQREIMTMHACQSPDCTTCKISFAVARKVGLLTYKSTSNLNHRFKDNSQEINRYLDYNARKFTYEFNRTSFLTYLNAMDSYIPNMNVKIAAKTLVISVDTDVLFPPDSQEALYQEIKRYNKETFLIKHSSPYGHDAFLKDADMGKHIQQFLSDQSTETLELHHNGGILATVGNTPLVNLSKLKRLHNLPYNLYVKLESFNPGGSVKDRPAKQILLNALETGLINPQTTIVEYSSGNMGIGLSQVCSYLGLKFICVVDTKTTEKTIEIMRAYGTEILKLTQPDPVTNEFLPAAIKRLKQMATTIPNCYWINQHGNIANAEAHLHTFKEIHQQLAQVDYLFCATSTCGTIRGCSEYIKANKLDTKIIAVDALGSSIFSNNKQKRIIPGHGAGLVPGILKREFIDEVLFVDAEQSITGARHLLDIEAILTGGSAGGVLTAVLDYSAKISAGSNVVMIAADRGERYLDTIYSDTWCANHHININNIGKASNA